MALSLTEYFDIYKKFKKNSLCIDIEVDSTGSMTVIGLYKPADGEIDCKSLIRGSNLTREELKESFKGVKLLITYNGNSMDIPKIKKFCPGLIKNDLAVIDLFTLAQSLRMQTGLKILENTFNIVRPDSVANKTLIANKLWQRYIKKKDKKALDTLLEYNRQDTINLYPLAEELMKIISQKKLQASDAKPVSASENYKKLR